MGYVDLKLGVYYRGQSFNILIAHTQTGQADLLRELRKLHIAQHGHMAKQFVYKITATEIREHSRRLTHGSGLCCVCAW